MFLDDNNSQPRKSNMIFSCGITEKDLWMVNKTYWKEDDCGHMFKLTAPVHVYLQAPDTRRMLVPVEGPVIFIAMGDDYWSKDGRIKNYRSKVVENPTYRTLLGAAKASQKVTGDYHHSFVEGVTFGGHEEVNGRKVMVLKLQFGS